MNGMQPTGSAILVAGDFRAADGKTTNNPPRSTRSKQNSIPLRICGIGRR